MCTLSWTGLPDGYLLYFNRDERRSREAALAPRIASNRPGGPEYVAAIDTAAGGTWLGVNEFGLSLAILNRYGGDATVSETKATERTGAEAFVAARTGAGQAVTEAFTSRGILVREMLDAPDLERLGKMLGEALTGRRFRPFDLLGFATSTSEVPSSVRLACLRFSWNGATLVRDEAPEAPISSSAFDTEAVLEVRRQLYATLLGDAPGEAGLEGFQRSHLPAQGAFSVCMHRPDAATRSLSQIRVDGQQVSMRYGPGPACRAQLGEPVLLARRPAHV